jgi:signal peptidase I
MAIIHCGGADFYELSKDVLARGACLRFQARGGSMRPLIRDGDILEVQPVEVAEVRVGDVIFFRGHRENMLAHRLVNKTRAEDGETKLIAKGDSASQFDRPVRPNQLFGKVISIERGQKRVELDSGLIKLIGLLWAKVPFISSRIYPFLRRSKRWVLKGASEVGHLARTNILW